MYDVLERKLTKERIKGQERVRGIGVMFEPQGIPLAHAMIQNILKDIIPLGIPWRSSGFNLASSLLGPWVRFLVRELDSQEAWHVQKKKKNLTSTRDIQVKLTIKWLFT